MVAVESFGVHWRLTMYSGGLLCTGLSIHHSQGYLRRTFRLDPRQRIMSAFSAALLAPVQLIGHWTEPLSPKWTIVSCKL